MTRPLLALGAAAAMMAAAAPAGAAVTVFAHRGGPVVDGKAAYPENTLPAFEHAARLGVGFELDVHVTKDGVPIVIHDGTFDRTTTCTGAINALTYKQVTARCRADVLGIPDDDVVPSRRTSTRTPIPSLAQVLSLARKARAKVDVEINDYPNYPDYDDTDAYAAKVISAIKASKIPRSSVIVQSFATRWLDVAKQRWPGVATALLSFSAQKDENRDKAIGSYAWISPQWPLDATWVSAAQASGLKVVPFTIDKAAAVRAAKAAGVEALITNDPATAKRALR